MYIFDENFEIKDKEDFLEFLRMLRNDNTNNLIQWENKTIKDYLDAIISWVEDIDGYYLNMHDSIPKDINWEFIAVLFYVGKIYE